jgi:membrane dipeptidase
MITQDEMTRTRNLAVEAGHVDNPRLREGGMRAPFSAFWVPGSYRGVEAVRKALDLRDAMQSVLDAHPDQIELATTAADIERIVRSGKISAFLTIRSASATNVLPVGNTVHDLDTFPQ